MSFRKPKSHRDAEDRAWRQWLAANEIALKRVGLPPGVTMSAAHWNDFLQNGMLDWHPESNDGFCFLQLSREQMEHLLAVLEAALETAPEFSEGLMIGWLRQRLGRPDPGQPSNHERETGT